MTVPERLLVSACQSASVSGGGGPASCTRASVASAAEPSRGPPAAPPFASGDEPSRAAPAPPPVPTGNEPSGAAPPAPPAPPGAHPSPAPAEPPVAVRPGASLSPGPHALTKAAVAPLVISRKRRRSTRAGSFKIALSTILEITRARNQR